MTLKKLDMAFWILVISLVIFASGTQGISMLRDVSPNGVKRSNQMPNVAQSHHLQHQRPRFGSRLAVAGGLDVFKRGLDDSFPKLKSLADDTNASASEGSHDSSMDTFGKVIGYLAICVVCLALLYICCTKLSRLQSWFGKARAQNSHSLPPAPTARAIQMLEPTLGPNHLIGMSHVNNLDGSLQQVSCPALIAFAHPFRAPSFAPCCLGCNGSNPVLQPVSRWQEQSSQRFARPGYQQQCTCAPAQPNGQAQLSPPMSDSLLQNGVAITRAATTG